MKKSKKAPRIKRERFFATFNNRGELIGSGNQCQENQSPCAVYCSRDEADADCCEEADDFVAEVVLVRAPKRRKGGK